MADVVIPRRTALDGLRLPANNSKVTITDAGPRARFIYQGDAARFGTTFGPSLPTVPCRAATLGERAALWLGPEEWLLLAATADGATLARALDALDSNGGSLVDVGHRSFGLIINGPVATQLLNSGCPLDLSVPAFPVDMCSRTLFAKAEIVLWRTEAQSFYVEAFRSYAPYLVGILTEAMRDVVDCEERPTH